MNTDGNLRKMLTVGPLVAVFVTLALTLLVVASARAATESFTTSGTWIWTAPAGVTNITVECWGGGGGGGG